MRIVIKTIVGLLLVLGLLVGLAHWQLARQTPDAVWEYDLEGVAGGIHVAGDTVLVNDTLGGEGWVAIDRESGKRLAGESQITVYEAKLGDNGWFAVRSGDYRDQTMTVYDETGRPVWQRRQGASDAVSLYSLADDGFVVATFDEVGDQKWRRQLQKISPDGKVLWQRPINKGEGGDPVYRQVRGQGEEPGDYVTVQSAPAIETAQGYRFLDDQGVPTGPAGPKRYTVAVDDMLVSTAVQDGECRFAAWRIEGEVWSSAAPCPAAEFTAYPQIAIGNLLIVSVPGADDPVLAINVADGAIEPAPYGVPHRFSGKTQEATAVSDSVAVEQDGSAFTARDPFTGKQLWTYDGPAPTKSLTSNKKDRYPGVSVSGDKVSILSNSKPWWRLFAWGASVPKSTTTILDARSGEEIATYRSASLYSTATTDDGDILLLADGSLRLLER